MRIMKLCCAGALAMLVVGAGSAAWAHSEFDPSTVTVGQVADLTLNLENEQADAGTVKIELFFPAGQPITVAAVPAAAGWTATVQGGSIGSAATGIVWQRATASPTENPAVSMRLGPIPDGATQLQFKVLQTYSNGAVDRWIEPWPAGQPEPERPAPVLAVEGATPGQSTSPTTAAATKKSDDDSNTGVIVAIVVIVVLAGGAAAWMIQRRRTGSAGGKGPQPPTS